VRVAIRGLAVMNHPLQCRCGTLKGYIVPSARVNRCVCYCRDCQAFAHFLGNPSEILDAQGGSDVTQTRPANVTFTQGREALACMRLTERGLLRWYTACCNTPIGNTVANYRLSFIGLVHSCLEGAGISLDDSFGPVRARVNTKSAKGEVRSGSGGMISAILPFIAIVARPLIDGSYRRTPLFLADTGAPIVTPKVLSRSERERVMSAV
jgi:Family of unknown function (DUF6151)